MDTGQQISNVIIVIIIMIMIIIFYIGFRKMCGCRVRARIFCG